MQIYINGTQVSKNSPLSIVCNATILDVGLEMKFYGPNELERACPNSPSTMRFSDGTTTRFNQLCVFEITNPMEIESGEYHCQVHPLIEEETCLQFQSEKISILAIDNTPRGNGTIIQQDNHCPLLEGVSIALGTLLFVLLVIASLLACKAFKPRKGMRVLLHTIKSLSHIFFRHIKVCVAEIMITTMNKLMMKVCIELGCNSYDICALVFKVELPRAHAACTHLTIYSLSCLKSSLNLVQTKVNV